MGVLEKATSLAKIASDTQESSPWYVCLACETRFELQHHTCPVCGSFDVRRSKWVEE